MSALGNRAFETSTTQGTVTYSLLGAQAGFQTLVAAAGNGSKACYLASDNVDWEIGIGTITDAAPDTLSRDTILASTNGGSAVNWGAGTRNIILTAPASILNELIVGSRNYLVAGGTANAITATPSPPLTAYADGQHTRIKAVATNTGATVHNNNGLGNRNVVTTDGAALAGGEIVSGGVYDLISVGTNQVLLNPSIRIRMGTEKATTSGTTSDFTGLPAGVRRITAMLSGVSTNGTSVPIFQLGDAGGFEATGYVGGVASIDNGAVSAALHSTGFAIVTNHVAAAIYSGAVVLSRKNGTHEWAISGALARSDSVTVSVISGVKTLSAELTQLRLTTVNGTDAFDAGSWNITWEF